MTDWGLHIWTYLERSRIKEINMEPRTDLMFGDWLPGCTVDTWTMLGLLGLNFLWNWKASIIYRYPLYTWSTALDSNNGGSCSTVVFIIQGFWPGEFESCLILCSPWVAKNQMRCDFHFHEYNWDISIGFSHVPILYFYDHDLTFLKQIFCIGHSDV